MLEENLNDMIFAVVNRLYELQYEIANNGAGVRYEVEFVGGTVPVDTPHYSAPFAAQDALKAMEQLMHSDEFEGFVITAEEAEAEYERRYAEVVRDLDLEPRTW